MSYKELAQACAQKYIDHKTTSDKLQNKKQERLTQIARLEKRIEKLSQQRPDWIKEFIQPLSAELMEETGAFANSIIGPCGLGSTAIICLQYENVHKWIEIRPASITASAYTVVDLTKNTGEFAPGTMGDVNGFNNPEIPIPSDADAAWFMQYAVTVDNKDDS